MDAKSVGWRPYKRKKFFHPIKDQSIVIYDPITEHSRTPKEER